MARSLLIVKSPIERIFLKTNKTKKPRYGNLAVAFRYARIAVPRLGGGLLRTPIGSVDTHYIIFNL